LADRSRALDGTSRSFRVLAAVATLVALPAPAQAEGPTRSTCYGTPERGRIEKAVSLPRSGPNFHTYSDIGLAIGRTCVHSVVAEIVSAAYADLAREMPSTTFVYGETSWCEGGPFWPHKTHQNGTSVDFMVPVKDATGASVPLPTSPLNKFGYDIEFDATGKFDGLAIDFAAITAHLYFLERQAADRGVKIRRVILAPEFERKLAGTRRWDQVSAKVPFSKGKPWVRHDEHYHVDFLPGCKAL
jgi:penicillin-insensitive murein endopeptidase